MSFHSFRDGNFNPDSEKLITKIWLWHDKRPLPYFLNIFIRKHILPNLRLMKHSISSKKMNSDLCKFNVTNKAIMSSDYQFGEFSLEDAVLWFEEIHKINESLKLSNGAWSAQPFATYFGKGISIEEIALRIYGYALAYETTENEEYLNTLMKAINYLIDNRISKSGHLILQGHTVIDTTYSFAIQAILEVYKITKEDKYLSIATNIADRLVEYHIAGSINHAAIPAMAFSEMYHFSGSQKYIREAIKRANWVTQFQLNYGGWPIGHESWTWYHCITSKSILATYANTPFTLENQKLKDDLAKSIVKSLNRLISNQRPDGTIAAGVNGRVYEERDEYGNQPVTNWANFINGKFVSSNDVKQHEFYSFELDYLCTTAYKLNINELENIINGLAFSYSKKKVYWRLEFDTMAVGSLLRYKKSIS